MLVRWLDENSDRLFLPSIAMAELTSGIAKLRRLGRSDDADALDQWLASIMHVFFWRIIPLDAPAAHQTGLLIDRARAEKLGASFADIAIGGIAEAHGMILLTRNLRHFAPLRIAAQDPFASLPD